jgi:hypothetical protein
MDKEKLGVGKLPFTLDIEAFFFDTRLNMKGRRRT